MQIWTTTTYTRLTLGQSRPLDINETSIHCCSNKFKFPSQLSYTTTNTACSYVTLTHRIWD